MSESLNNPPSNRRKIPRVGFTELELLRGFDATFFVALPVAAEVFLAVAFADALDRVPALVLAFGPVVFLVAKEASAAEKSVMNSEC